MNPLRVPFPSPFGSQRSPPSLTPPCIYCVVFVLQALSDHHAETVRLRAPSTVRRWGSIAVLYHAYACISYFVLRVHPAIYYACISLFGGWISLSKSNHPPPHATSVQLCLGAVLVRCSPSVLVWRDAVIVSAHLLLESCLSRGFAR